MFLFSPRSGCIATREGVLRAHAANAGSCDECSRRSRQKASPEGGAPAGHDRVRLCPRACQTPRVAGRHRALCRTTTLPSGVCGVVGEMGGAATRAQSWRRASASARFCIRGLSFRDLGRVWTGHPHSTNFEKKMNYKEISVKMKRFRPRSIQIEMIRS